MSSRTLRPVIIVVALLMLGGVIGLSLLGRPVVWLPSVSQPARRPLGLVLHGQVQAAARREVLAPAAGKVLGLLTSQGQPVAQGQQMMQLDAPALRQQLVEARQRVPQLEALHEKARDRTVHERLDKAEQQARDAAGIAQERRKDLDDYKAQHPEAVTLLDTLDQARRRAATAERELRRAEQELAASQERSGRTGKPDPHLDMLQSQHRQCLDAHKIAQARLADAVAGRQRLREEIERLAVLRQRVDSALKLQRELQAQLQRLRRQPAIIMLTQGEQRVQAARDRLAEIERQVAALSVRAPVAGTLQDLRVRPGDAVTTGQVLALVEEAGGARMVFAASLEDMPRLAVGHRAKVRPQGGKTFAGAVSQLAPEKSSVRVYVVPVRPTPLPPPGTALEARL